MAMNAAVRGWIDDWDTLTRNRGKNGYFYRRPTDGRWTLQHWDSLMRCIDRDPHTLVHALAQTQLAVETAVVVRDRVVEAYQEIMRMPV